MSRVLLLGVSLMMTVAISIACRQSPAQTTGTTNVTPTQLFPPAELGSLEAPDRAVWQQPERVMDALGIADSSRVADFGAGGGWFTTFLARRVGPNGIVYAQDVQPEMIGSINRRMKAEGLTNFHPILGTRHDAGLPSGLHAILVVDTYPQLADPVATLKQLAGSLAPGGKLGIVDFKNDGSGGPGPPIQSRIAPEAVIRDAKAAGLELASRELLRYQYLLVFMKPG